MRRMKYSEKDRVRQGDKAVQQGAKMGEVYGVAGTAVKVRQDGRLIAGTSSVSGVRRR